MSEEFDHNPDSNYSTFWPLLILMIGLLIWSGYQVYATNSQRRSVRQAIPSRAPHDHRSSERIGTRYVALMKDLVETAQKDQAAAQIVKDAIAAGLIHVQPNATNSASGTPPPATPSK